MAAGIGMGAALEIADRVERFVRDIVIHQSPISAATTTMRRWTNW